MRVLIVILIVIFSLLSFAGKMSLEMTDNLFNSSDKIYDLLLSFEYNFKKNFNRYDLFLNAGINTPIVNNYYATFPSDLLFQFVINDRIDEKIYSGLYSYQLFYINSNSFEKNVIIPGIFIDFKKNFNFVYTLKNSFDIYYKDYPLTPTFSSAFFELENKNIIYFPFNSSMHLNIKTGYKKLNDIFLINLKPLFSFNLFNSIGFSFSYNFIKTTTKNVYYYIDETFTDEYYYNKLDGFIGKITFQFNKNSKIVFSSKFKSISFNPIIHLDSDTLFQTGDVEIRKDRVFGMEIILVYSLLEKAYNLKYEYINKKSTNGYNNYSSNSVSFYFQF